MRRYLCLLMAALMLGLAGCGGLEDEAADIIVGALEDAVDSLASSSGSDGNTQDDPDWAPAYGGYYYDVENVVLYLTAYGELPPNYITKDEARDLGWNGGGRGAIPGRGRHRRGPIRQL